MKKLIFILSIFLLYSCENKDLPIHTYEILLIYNDNERDTLYIRDVNSNFHIDPVSSRFYHTNGLSSTDYYGSDVKEFRILSIKYNEKTNKN